MPDMFALFSPCTSAAILSKTGLEFKADAAAYMLQQRFGCGRTGTCARWRTKQIPLGRSKRPLRARRGDAKHAPARQPRQRLIGICFFWLRHVLSVARVTQCCPESSVIIHPIKTYRHLLVYRFTGGWTRSSFLASALALSKSGGAK